jgi:hypothetical protein
LKLAHKIKAAEGSKLLLVSKTPPGYLSRISKATLPIGVPKAHAPALEPQAEVKAVETAAVKDSVGVELKEAEKPVEETKTSDEEQHTSGRSGRRGR